MKLLQLLFLAALSASVTAYHPRPYFGWPCRQGSVKSGKSLSGSPFDYSEKELQDAINSGFVECDNTAWCLFKCIDNEGGIASVEYCNSGVIDNKNPEKNDFCDTFRYRRYWG
ncbi:hypothetical protein BDV26DRAFT_254601 [Aspergillus bertholletiae]|uniref:Uncharacterized protein n=1 Tax=Aspergillus bertholletiae TaxID=1226010 RepID=A0A5N7BJM0_9EURO|nr:hypothetical protein BDV26DRAFT_254601 [Aspergillus bertholletiae]